MNCNDTNINTEPGMSSEENANMEGGSDGVKSEETPQFCGVKEEMQQAAMLNSQQTPIVYDNTTNMVPPTVSINSYPPGTYMIGGQIVNNVPSNMMPQESVGLYHDMQQVSANHMQLNPHNFMYANQQAQNNLMYINPQNSNSLMYPQTPSNVMYTNPQNPTQVMYVNPQNPNQIMYQQTPQSMYYINPQNPNQVMLMTPQTSNNVMYVNPQNPNQVMYMNPQNSNTLMYVNPQNPNQLMYMNPQIPNNVMQTNQQNPMMYIDPQNPNQVMYLAPQTNNVTYVNPQSASNMYSQSVAQNVDSSTYPNTVGNQMLGPPQSNLLTQEAPQPHVVPAEYSAEASTTSPVPASSPTKRVKKVIYRNPNRAILPAEDISQRNTESLLVPVDIAPPNPNKKMKHAPVARHASVKMLLAAKRNLVELGPEIICSGCISTFANDINAFKKHHCTGVKEKRCYCNHCFQLFYSLKEYNGHVCKTPDKKYNCNVCNSKLKTLDMLYKHNFLHTRNNAFSCPVCQLIFQTPKILDNHMSCHKNEKSQGPNVENRVSYDSHMFPQSNMLHAEMSNPHPMQANAYVVDPNTYNLLMQNMSGGSMMYSPPVPSVCESCPVIDISEEVNTPEPSTPPQAREPNTEQVDSNTCDSAAVQAEAAEALEAFEASLEATCGKTEESPRPEASTSGEMPKEPDTLASSRMQLMKSMDEFESVLEHVNAVQDLRERETKVQEELNGAKSDSAEVSSHINNSSEPLMEIKMLTDNINTEESVNKDSNQFPCPMCKTSYPTSVQLSEHSCNERTCTYCNKVFFGQDSFLEFTKHVKYEHTPNIGGIYTCAECSHKFKNIRLLKLHTRKHLKKLIYCSLCNIVFSNTEELEQHMLSHRSDSAGFCCVVCNAKFAFVRSMTRHMREVHTVSTTQACDEPEQTTAQ